MPVVYIFASMERTMKKVVPWFLLFLVTVTGFATKFYSGPGGFWVNNSFSAVFYELFWCLVLFILFPSMPPWKIAATVLLVTCFLEFLQMWHPPFLQYIRSFFIGRALIGTSFTWSDFLYYAIGSGLGWVLLKRLAFEG